MSKKLKFIQFHDMNESIIEWGDILRVWKSTQAKSEEQASTHQQNYLTISIDPCFRDTVYKLYYYSADYQERDVLNPFNKDWRMIQELTQVL